MKEFVGEEIVFSKSPESILIIPSVWEEDCTFGFRLQVIRQTFFRGLLTSERRRLINVDLTPYDKGEKDLFAAWRCAMTPILSNKPIFGSHSRIFADKDFVRSLYRSCTQFIADMAARRSTLDRLGILEKDFVDKVYFKSTPSSLLRHVAENYPHILVKDIRSGVPYNKRIRMALKVI